MASPLFHQVNLVVRDMDATLAFYRAAGLEIPAANVWRTSSGAHHAQAPMGNGLELEFDSEVLASVYNAGWREVSANNGRCVLSFRLESRDAVDETCRALAVRGYTYRNRRTTRFGDRVMRSCSIRTETTSDS
jgi:catechol 2,3-dioxygenase-like lactoylglutathione lyase family enzyme